MVENFNAEDARSTGCSLEKAISTVRSVSLTELRSKENER